MPPARLAGSQIVIMIGTTYGSERRMALRGVAAMSGLQRNWADSSTMRNMQRDAESSARAERKTGVAKKAVHACSAEGFSGEVAG